MTMMTGYIGGNLMRPTREPPRYRCHKIVWALKIASIRPAAAPTIAELDQILNGAPIENKDVIGAYLTPEDPGYGEFPVSRDYVLKHEPTPGGYWVQYDNDYTSFSPAKAFEDGYTIIVPEIVPETP